MKLHFTSNIIAINCQPDSWSWSILKICICWSSNPLLAQNMSAWIHLCKLALQAKFSVYLFLPFLSSRTFSSTSSCLQICQIYESLLICLNLNHWARKTWWMYTKHWGSPKRETVVWVCSTMTSNIHILCHSNMSRGILHTSFHQKSQIHMLRDWVDLKSNLWSGR